LFTEPWWVVEGTAGTSGSTTISIPDGVNSITPSWYTSLTEIVITNKGRYGGYGRINIDVSAGTDKGGIRLSVIPCTSKSPDVLSWVSIR